MSSPQRRKMFIDSKVQGALTRRIILHWMLFMGVASIAALFLQVLSDPFRPLGEHLSNVWYSHGPFLAVMVFLLPVFVIDTIKLSHRFAGPIYNLRRTMRRIAEGEPPRKLKFRQGDFWQELATDYNAMISRLVPLNDEKSATEQQSPVHVAD